MNLLDQFKSYLLGRNSNKLTVKNYLSDTRRFVLWCENKFHRPFNPDFITKELANAYIEELISLNQSPRSIKRYQSSIKRFFEYLMEQNLVRFNPFLVDKPSASSDPWFLKEFDNYLYNSKSSDLTIKNYIMDVRQFFNWAEAVTGLSNSLDPESSRRKKIFSKIDEILIEEYKDRLIDQAKFSPVSVNRKLSSLRKYLTFAQENNLLKHDFDLKKSFFDLRIRDASANIIPQADSANEEELAFQALLNQNNSSTDTLPSAKNESYSKFAPLRLAQKLKLAVTLATDFLIIASIIKTIEAIKYKLWIATGKEVFASLPTVVDSFAKTGEIISSIPSQPLRATSNASIVDQFMINDHKPSVGRFRSIPKSVYAPLEISTKSFSPWKKTLHFIRHSRPGWYNKYHNFRFVHYLHFGILLIYASVLGIKIYQSLKAPESPSKVLAIHTSPKRIISIRGTLHDEFDNPITRESPVRFAIYKSQSSDSSPLWEEKQSITPDASGNFSVTLGNITSLSQDIFNDNPNLYLGIKIGSAPELTPRQQLASSGLTKNAEELQGLKPITVNNGDTRNSILALDSSGNLTIGGESSPIFQATGGEFKLTGQQLTLATNPGSNTNIVLSPDGNGIIDVQRPLQNTSNNGNVESTLGAVEIDDNLAIIASSSAQSALVINQIDSGEIISAQSGSSAKFTLSNNGSGMFAGDLSILGSNLSTTADTFNIAGTNTHNLNIGTSATKISIGAPTGTTTVNNGLDVNGLINAKGGLAIPNFTPGTIPFIGSNNQVASDSASLFWEQNNKRLGIGTSTPSYRLSVVESISQSGGAVATFTNTNTTTNSANTANVLRLNSGASAVTGTRFISFYANCTTENCSGTQIGSIQANGSNNLMFQSGSADFAERFNVPEPTEPGDVIGTDTYNNRKGRIGDSILGVVSDSAIIVGNSPENINKQQNPVVGLLGQVRTKVTTENGEIKKGDLLTLSSIPGVAKKATQTGEVLGTALENYSGTGINRILVLVRPGWHQEDGNITSSGTIEAIIKANSTSQNPPIESDSDKTSEKLVSSIQNFVNTLNTGVLEVGNLSVNSLYIATDDIKVGTQTLKAYISSIVNEIVDKKIAENNRRQVSILSPISENSSTISPIPSPSASPTANLVPNQSVVNITNVYNNASVSASPTLPVDVSPTPSPNVTSQASPSAVTVTPTIPESIPSSAPISAVPTPTIMPANQATSQNYSSSPNYIPSASFNTSFANVATYSAELSYVPNLKSDFATFTQGLITLGPTSLTDTSINGELSIGQSLKITETAINTIGTELNIQPLRQGNLSIMGGLVSIDTEGNLTVNGNAAFAKNVTVKGTLAAGIISPVGESDLIVRLPKSRDTDLQNPANQHDSSFIVSDASGSAKFSVNNTGDVISSGSGTFANFKLIRGAQADDSLTQTTASGSAGTAVINAHQTERTIVTPFVTDKSLIYITPVSSTFGTNPYIARQTQEDTQRGSKGSFTIQIQQAQNADIKFNWVIIN